MGDVQPILTERGITFQCVNVSRQNPTRHRRIQGRAVERFRTELVPLPSRVVFLGGSGRAVHGAQLFVRRDYCRGRA